MTDFLILNTKYVYLSTPKIPKVYIHVNIIGKFLEVDQK